MRLGCWCWCGSHIISDHDSILRVSEVGSGNTGRGAARVLQWDGRFTHNRYGLEIVQVWLSPWLLSHGKPGAALACHRVINCLALVFPAGAAVFPAHSRRRTGRGVLRDRSHRMIEGKGGAEWVRHAPHGSRLQQFRLHGGGGFAVIHGHHPIDDVQAFRRGIRLELLHPELHVRLLGNLGNELEV